MKFKSYYSIPRKRFQKRWKTQKSVIKHDELRNICKKIIKGASGRCSILMVILVADRGMRSRCF